MQMKRLWGTLKTLCSILWMTWLMSVLPLLDKSINTCACHFIRRLLSKIQMYQFTSSAEYEDQLQFLDLIKSLLNVDAAKRISASEALNHPFITMAHLLNPEFKY